MKDLFRARSVAVVGVSESDDNLARNILSNLIRFEYSGKIYAVGPRGGDVFGIKIYRSVAELPESVDLAVILVPADFVPSILTQCGEKKIQWAVVQTGGFQEFRGSESDGVEQDILRICTQYNLRFVGPNCIGVVNPSIGLCTPFVAFPRPFRSGNVGVFSQSGGVAVSVAEKICSSGMGISKFVSMGNKLRIDEADFLEYAGSDPDTAIIYFYLEGFKKGRKFVELAKQCTRPIMLHKSNCSPLSSNIAQSHTAALAVDDEVVDAVCLESGIIRVHSVSEATNLAKGFTLPALQGNNLAVITRSGGFAVVAADACAQYGFHLPELNPAIFDEAQGASRAGVIRSGNPLDLGDIYDTSFYLRIVEKTLHQENIDGIVFMQVNQAMDEQEETRYLVEKLMHLSRKTGKPIALVVDIPRDDRMRMEKMAEFPFFFEPMDAIKALATQYQWQKENQKKIAFNRAPDRIPLPVDENKTWMAAVTAKKRQPLLHEALDFIEKAGIPVAPWAMATTPEEAVQAAEGIGFPVALKVVSTSLLHKSDAGGVVLNVADPERLRKEWQHLEGVHENIKGIVVQKMNPESRELIIGAKRDPLFGPVVLVGLGGIMVEAIKDFQMRLAPIDLETALQMLEGLSGIHILGSFRGMHGIDLTSIAHVLVQVSLLIHHFPQIMEIDLNPVSFDHEGKMAIALDSRLIL